MLHKFKSHKKSNAFGCSITMLMLLLIAILNFSATFQIKFDPNSKFSKRHYQNTDPLRIPVSIEVYYPSAKVPAADYLTLRGDNCNLSWNSGMLLVRTLQNKWIGTINCPQAIVTNVKVLYNDKIWMIGKNWQFVPKMAQTVKIYPSFSNSVNKIIDTPKVHSQILNNDRQLSIYVPPSYYDNTLKTYEVLLMHDGQNLFDNQKAAFGVAWMCQDTVNKMIAMGQMRQIIIVGVWNTNDRNNQYTYSYDPSYKFGGKGAKYLDFLQKQLIPLLKSKYLTGRINDSNGYYIGGSSLGGLISCYAAYTRPTIFTKAICMSSSFWWNSQDFNTQVLKTETYYKSLTLYLDSGDSGTNQDSKNQTLRVYQHFNRIGYQNGSSLHYYLDKGGQHNEYYWGKRFNVPMKDLFS